MNIVRAGIIGLAVADALGVPVEFKSREELRQNPVTDMIGFGTYNQPQGTWSDDSSLTFCIAEALLQPFKLEYIAENFVAWKENAKWTPHGKVFDIGIQTSKALGVLSTMLKNKDYAGLQYLKNNQDEFTNGNGSLMRILPLYFILNNNVEDQFEMIWEVSALTHPHIRSALACFIYLIMMDELIQKKNKDLAYEFTQKRVKAFFSEKGIGPHEINHFKRIIEGNIKNLEEKEIKSGGYVIDSLEASLWCFLTTHSYQEAVLRAVNLGSDTDTTGAITGGLAGIYYGIEAIPKTWYENLSKIKEIENLCDDLFRKYPLL